MDFRSRVLVWVWLLRIDLVFKKFETKEEAEKFLEDHKIESVVCKLEWGA